MFRGVAARRTEPLSMIHDENLNEILYANYTVSFWGLEWYKLSFTCSRRQANPIEMIISVK